jgi:hypothetical protein
MLACLLGVITHIETDIVFHPFVYAHTGTTGIGCHYQIETDIDGYFLRRGTAPAYRHLADMLSPDVRQTLAAACGLLFDPDGTLPRSALEHALALHCRIQSLYDKTFWKLAVRILALVIGSPFKEQRHLFYPLSRPPAVGSFDESTYEWRHPVSGDLYCCTLEELVSRAVRRSNERFKLIEETGSLAAALGSQPGENLLTGLYGVCRIAMTDTTFT